jgi:hypothetical protein
MAQIFTIHHPVVKTIPADNYNEAVKNFIKLHREKNIENMIISDNLNNYRKALINFYLENGRRKARISFNPYNPVIGLLNPEQNNKPLPLQFYPTITPRGIKPSIEINAHGFGPSNLIVPMLY